MNSVLSTAHTGGEAQQLRADDSPKSPGVHLPALTQQLTNLLTLAPGAPVPPSGFHGQPYSYVQATHTHTHAPN